MTKLIIIGNGFDLRCGLASSFPSFFMNVERKKISDYRNQYTRSIDNSDINFISFLLYLAYFDEKPIQYYGSVDSISNVFRKKLGIPNDHDSWMSVELFLHILLTSNLYKELDIAFNKHIKGNYYLEPDFLIRGDSINIFLNEALTCRGVNKNTLFNDFIFKELKCFENEFINYLDKVVDSNPFYKEKSKWLLGNLSNGEKSIILNFNYTKPSITGNSNSINVHGTLEEKDIIIGINDDNHSDFEKIRFTKTFRKLECIQEEIVLEEGINEIIIYGHSLGTADYAYFQSIFDFVNLYSSRVVLNFVYSDYFLANEEKTIHKVKITKDLFKLMKAYGETLDNKDNGRNIIHKMMLEGRLKVTLDNFLDIPTY